MAQGTPTLLKALLREQHWQTYRRFRRGYIKVAGALDPDLAGSCPSESTFRRWLNGRIEGLPRAEPCAVLEKMFPGHTAEQLFGPYRELTQADDAGTDPIPAASAVEVYGLNHQDLSRSIETVTGLWRQDVHRRDFLQGAATVSAAFIAPALDFLVQPRDETVERNSGGKRVTMADARLIRTVSDQARTIDQTFGGARYRTALLGFLDGEVSEMLNGTYSDAVGRELHAAAAEATCLLGWMAHDIGRYGLAQRYYTEALRLAQAAGDTSQGASILSFMGYLARDSGNHREAVQLTRAGVTRGSRATPAVQAHLHAFEAWALVSVGDKRGVLAAIDNATRGFDRSSPSDLDLAEMTRGDLLGLFGHCYTSLGMTREGEEVVTEALVELESSPRSRSFCVLHAANLAVQHRDAEHAAVFGVEALELLPTLTSSRVEDELRAFVKHLNTLGGSAVIRDFTERAHDYEMARVC